MNDKHRKMSKVIKTNKSVWTYSTIKCEKQLPPHLSMTMTKLLIQYWFSIITKMNWLHILYLQEALHIAGQIIWKTVPVTRVKLKRF